MDKFPHLKPAFVKWLKEKRAFIKKCNKFDLKANADEILSWSENAINIKALDEILKDIAELGPPPFIEAILKRLAYFYRWVPANAPVLFDANLTINNLPNALDWTLVNISELKFFDMSDIDFKKPYKQCYYCGKPDDFEHKSGNKSFNKKIKYCHDYNCDLTNPDGSNNPMLHEDNCCYRKYAIAKKKLIQQLRAKKITKDEQIRIFIEYCEKVLQENMGDEEHIENERIKNFEDIFKIKRQNKGRWTIQTKSKKAIYSDNWYS